MKPLKVIKVYDFLLETNREKFFLLLGFPLVPPLTDIWIFFSVFVVDRFWFVSGCSWVESLNWLVTLMCHHLKQLRFFLILTITSLNLSVGFSGVWNCFDKENESWDCYRIELWRKFDFVVDEVNKVYFCVAKGISRVWFWFLL